MKSYNCTSFPADAIRGYEFGEEVKVDILSHGQVDGSVILSLSDARVFAADLIAAADKLEQSQ